MEPPPPPKILQHFIDQGQFTEEEYKEVFVDEWNKIFPNGFDCAINKLVELFKNCGKLEEMRKVINRSLAIIEGGFEDDVTDV